MPYPYIRGYLTLYSFPLNHIEILTIMSNTAEIVSPKDIGINQVQGDRLCIYCQLILYPGANTELKHQPSWMALERSAATCILCKLILRILRAEAILQDVRLDIVRMSEVLDRLPEVQQLCDFVHSTAITIYLVDFREKYVRGFKVSCASRGHRPRPRSRPRRGIFGSDGVANNWETEYPPYIYFCTEEYLGQSGTRAEADTQLHCPYNSRISFLWPCCIVRLTHFSRSEISTCYMAQ